jgi:hypothetical protein
MITMLQETTDWGNAPVKNGVYHVNEHDQLVAYHAPGAELKEFSTPMKRFSRARRKFVVLDTYEDENVDTSVERIEFTGSKGNTYVVTVDGDDIACTCPGYRFQGKCKHITEVAAR